jgi:hypothetical protein
MQRTIPIVRVEGIGDAAMCSEALAPLECRSPFAAMCQLDSPGPKRIFG